MSGQVRAGIYVRVSTTEQSSDAQVSQLEGYVARMGWPRPCLYRDDGISGVLDNRPGLDLLREDLRTGNVGTVVATKLDRLGRSVLGVLGFFDECDRLGVRVVVTDQGFDTSTPAGRLMRNVLAALAEFERELILERTKTGIERARKKGVRFGRKPKPLPDGGREWLLTLRREGRSIREIAETVHISRSRVERLLRPPTVSKLPPPPGPLPSDRGPG